MEFKLKIAYVSTVPFFMDHQLSGQIIFLLNHGYDVSAITSPEGDWGRLNKIASLRCFPLHIYRRPAPLADLLTLFRLFVLFRRQRFDIVHSFTPKAGLLCALAARLSGVPLRVHTFTGQQWATMSGLSRWLMAKFDRAIVKLNTQSYADSFTQREFLLQEGVTKEDEIHVLGKGSLSGVNLRRFSRTNCNSKIIRQELGITTNDFVISFVGRLTTEKGIIELLYVFRLLLEKYPNVHLLLIGPLEDAAVGKQIALLKHVNNLHVLGPSNAPENYLCITDVFCLPSYREGFGTSVIEAAAMGVPTVGSNIYGLRDAVIDGATGLLVAPNDPQALYEALEQLINNEAFRQQLSHNALHRCIKEFDSNKINRLITEEYERLWQKTKTM